MIKQILDEIANEPGSNAKMDILRKYVGNGLLEDVLYMACSKRVKFYIKQIPDYTPGLNVRLDLIDALTSLSKLSSRELTGHNAINYLSNLLESVTEDDAYVIERIIDKDLKIGMGTSNINKVFKGLIEKTPYMGAKAYDKDLAMAIFKDGGKGISQVKMDGRYNNAIIRGGEVEMESRGGEPVVLTGAKFLKELSNLPDGVLNGELTMDGVDRYKSNGMIMSLIKIGTKESEGNDITKEIAKFEKKHMPYEEALNLIKYTIWDRITVDEYFEKKCLVPYYNRLEQCRSLVENYNLTMTEVVESIEVTCFEDAMSHFQESLEREMEGTVLKAYDGTWKDGKPKWQVKMKLEMDIDLKITGFNYGTPGTKNENVISSLTAESADGKMICNPAGIDEDMMEYITKNQKKLMGTIVECKCNGLTPFNEKLGAYSVLSPVFKTLRDDKTKADDFEAITKIEDMVKGLA